MKPRTLVGPVLAGLLLPACTAVLGMDEAKLDDGRGAVASGGSSGGGSGGAAGSGAGGYGGVPRVGTACEQDPGPTCTQCLQTNCSAALRACVSTGTCRLKLDKFATCLGTTCNADQESCAFDIQDPELTACVGSCSSACSKVTIASQCELYCACMDQCPDERSSLGDCMAACAALPAEVRSCRRDHCEYGHGDPTHCRHASGRLQVCKSYTEQPKDHNRTTCLDGKETTWACDTDDECCSGNCLDGSCS
jgi:hypothetical protein